ncbi:MAG: lipoprotein signal peptidase [Bacteroidia bacterium]|nr:lipoprotein signal peptidase [Bacteroidia bacterium]HQV00808.1 lipoprotein signal peptidase [Bacteroidia bacterium]
MHFKQFKLAATLIFTVLLADQLFKFWVKTNMYLGQEFHIAGQWFIIHFVENEGMAFGLSFGGNYGKLALSLFRVAAVCGIGYYLYKLIKEGVHTMYVTSLSLIFAGAIGNIIDSIFYGVLFSSSEFQVATFLPAEGGYATWMHGRVVDMLYFPLIRGTFPDWFPLWANQSFEFFRPVFNLADSSITIGVCLFLIFQKQIFKSEQAKNTATPTQDFQ